MCFSRDPAHNFTFLLSGLSWAGDFNDDGMEDLVWHPDTNGGVALWLMNGGSILQACSLGGVDPNVWNLAFVGDLNGDNKSDLVWNSRVTNSVVVWFINGCSLQ